MTQDELIQIYDGTESIRKKGAGTNPQKENNENEICSQQVLRRIENGGVKRVKINIFRQLMEKMGLLPERIYASIFVTDCRALRWKTEIHVHIRNREYEQAEKKLQELEPMLVPNYPRNEQYLMERRATIAYYRGEMQAEEYLETLWEALRCTIPMLDEIDIARWPFNENEFDILSGIGNAYHFMKDTKKELEFLLKLKENMEKEYMDGDHYTVWHMRALEGLSQFMCISGQHEKSMEYCETGIEECRKQRILGSIHCLLYDIAWNRENMIRKGLFPKAGNAAQQEESIKKERACCKKQLVQAYYLSVAQGDIHDAERVKKLYEVIYPNEVKLL